MLFVISGVIIEKPENFKLTIATLLKVQESNLELWDMYKINMAISCL